jgi:hypothetical protein
MDMMPIMNIFNEWHSANTSKKLRAVTKSGAKAGKHKCTYCSYGYFKGDDENRTPVIDSYAATVVRRIFEMRANGIGLMEISEILNEEKILTPSDYLYHKLGKTNPHSMTHLWSKSAIGQVLRNPIYIGTLAQQRRPTVSYKNHKRVPTSEEDWIVIENNHEPIVSRELWDKVREYEKSVSRGKRNNYGFVDTFSGMLYCADCGYKMKQIWINRRNKGHGTAYSCGYHARFGKNYCSTHTIRGNVLEALVIADIQSKLMLVVNEDKARKQFLEKKSGDRTSQTAIDTKRKHELEYRITELDTLTQSVYENMVLGKIPEEVCVKLIEKYQEENKALQTELDTVLERLKALNQDEHDVDEFIRRLKKYAGFEVLTREMLLDLVEYITIEDVPENRNVPRKIHIYYKFLGKELANKQNALVHGISTSKKLVNKIQQDKTTNMWYNKRKSQRRYIP